VHATLSSNLTLDPRVEADLEQFGALYPFPLDEFQREAIRTLLRGDSVMVAAPTGTGKALASDTPVLTPTGWTPIGAIRPGDYVIGADGRPTSVCGVFPQGTRPGYKVTFTDGTSVVCNLEHLWAVNTKWRNHEGRPFRVLTLAQILEEGLSDGEGRRHFVPMVRPVEFSRSHERRRQRMTAGAYSARALVTARDVSAPTLGQRLGDYLGRGATRAVLALLALCSLYLALMWRRFTRRGNGAEGLAS